MEVIRRVLEKYKPILKEKNIKSIQDVNELYTKKRLDILNTLIQDSPNNYRVADAKFDLGRVHWEYAMNLGLSERKEHMSKAIQAWNSIGNSDTQNGDFLNQKAWEEIRSELQKSQVGNAKEPNFNSQNKISQILRNRLGEVLNQKKVREDRLLWKRKEKDSSTSPDD